MRSGRHFAIINGKSGRCSENCKYCAQAGCYAASVEEYPLLPSEKLVEGAMRNAKQGVLRYSIVTSGRKLNKSEVDRVYESIQEIKKQVEIEVCVSFGLLEEEDFAKLKKPMTIKSRQFRQQKRPGYLCAVAELWELGRRWRTGLTWR